MTQLADTRERYLTAFKTFAGNGAAGAPPWLKEMREAAIARFAELGFPTTRQEEWRFTSVAPIAETTFTLSHGRETAQVTRRQLEPLCVGGPRAVRVVFVATAGAGPTVSHPRSLVVLERGAQATVVESYVALADGLYWTNAVTEVAVGDGARLEHYRLQRESRQAYQVATTHATQGRDSVLRLHPIALGGGLARHDVHTVLAGSGAELILNGFYLLHGSQHSDHHTVIDHAQPHCASHEFFNGIVGEQGHGVFNGRIIVRPGAQRTDSKQTNNNLLLSTAARADSQPQLEIYADDVKCTHGSTVGPLDQTALYYLRSRGLSPETAAGMLTYGFAAEILGRMAHTELREELDRVVRARLADRSRGGRRA